MEAKGEIGCLAAFLHRREASRKVCPRLTKIEKNIRYTKVIQNSRCVIHLRRHDRKRLT